MHTKPKRAGLLLVPVLLGAILLAVPGNRLTGQAAANRFPGPTSSQPLALDAAGSILLVANPDNNTVTLFDVAENRNRRVQEQAVGIEPNGVAISPDGTRAFVANTWNGTVGVYTINRAGRLGLRWLTDIRVGVEPYGLALTPNGRKLYVTNARSNSLSIIDARANRVLKTIENVGFEPRGLAITNDNDDDDNDETVFVTQFLALPVPGKIDGEDDSKRGHVTVIETGSDEVIREAYLNPIADSGFRAAGDAIARRPPPAQVTEESLTFTTGAYPNQFNGAAIKGDYVFFPNTGASPNGPTRFDVNTQALLSVLSRRTYDEPVPAVNMHVAVRRQTATPRLFVTQPWAMAFKNRGEDGYVLSAASNVMVKVRVNPATGLPEVLSDPANPGRVLQVPTGKNPRGIAVNSGDTRAYVMNYVSRDVTVVDLTGPAESVVATLRSTNLPEEGTFEDIVQAGKELYHTSVGEFDGLTPLAPKIRGRMSNNGWGSCASCHPNGLTDNVVWIFGAGPRRTIPQHADFDPTDPEKIRPLNWSAIFDEEEDFENNIRGVSGGLGILIDENGNQGAIGNFTPASGGRRQLLIRGYGGWDAIKAYVQFGIRPPLAPVKAEDPDAIAGRQIFIDNNCQSCHGGATWSSPRVTHTPPPAASLLANGQIIGALSKVGTFDATLKTEVRQNAAAPLGADGFVPPSLLSISAWPKTFFHNGTAESLEAVMENVAHRSSGTQGVDRLRDAESRRRLVRFLLSIDPNTEPVPVP